MNDEGVLREAKYITQALATCRANCDEMATKYRGVMESDARARDCDWLKNTVSFIDRQAVYAQIGIEEVQIYKMTHQLLVESDLRVRKYTNELRAAEQRIDLLLNELRYTQEMLQKSEAKVVEQETKIADLMLLCDLKSLDDLNKAEPFSINDTRFESVLSNMSMASRGGYSLGNDRTLMFGDTQRLDEADEETEPEERSAESVEKVSAGKTSGETLVNDEDGPPPPKRILTEAEQMRKRRNLAVTLFNSNVLDQSARICKELLTQSHQRIVETAGANVKDGDGVPPSAECVWEMAERHETENKCIADQTDDERAAMLASIDAKSEDIQSVMKVLGEIYRRNGQYRACELLEDVMLRIRSQNPATVRKHVSKLRHKKR